MRVLIIGFGNMGPRYAKYLDKFGVRWDYYDPYVGGGLKKLSDVKLYSHIIISTPPETHYKSYRDLMSLNFKGHIYIDKPVVIYHKHLDIFENKNVFSGITERYNPAVVKLKELLDLESLISIKFTRYSTVPANIKVPVIFDLGIHDLDLYLYLLGYDEFPNIYDVFKKSKTNHIVADQHNILSIFEWSHESHMRERKIKVLQKDVVYEVDLIDQTVLAYEADCVIKNLYVNKTQPLKEIVEVFLNGETNDTRISHEFMMDVINREEYKYGKI